jgi:tetratricopeptide (TPR) repeat protein
MTHNWLLPYRVAIAALLALKIGEPLLMAQQDLFPQEAPPLPRPSAPAAGTGDEEVRKPDPFSDQERRVVNSADELPIERLQELLGVYERLDNVPMIDSLSRVILRRDPKNIQALKARADINPAEETRAVGYMETLAKKVLAGQRVEDIDSIGIHANNLLAEDRDEEALRLLLALRQNQFQGQFFPFQDDLAYAYSENGLIDEADKAYRAVAEDQRFSVDVRQEARRLLPGLELKRQMQRIRSSAGGNYDRLVSEARSLLNRNPDSHDALAFYIECLDMAKRYTEVVDLLVRLKAKVPARTPWIWQTTLGYAYYGAKRFDDAEAAFTEIKNNSKYDPSAKLEAESMLIEIGVGREIEDGIVALNRSDLASAGETLRRLEKTNPSHSDTLGFKAIYLSKVGRSDEALQLLGDKRQKMESQGLAFSQADALADVYVTRKEYSQARATVLQVLNDPRYDAEARSAARMQLANIEVAEKLEEGYIALRDSRRNDAQRILEEVRATSPTSEFVALFAADVDLAFGRNKEALTQFQTLKQKHQGPAAFPGQGSYASALARNDEWQAAADAYREMTDDMNFREEDRQEAMWALRGLYPYFRPQLESRLSFMNESEGNTLSTESEYLSGWHQHWRFGAFARTDSVSVKGDSIFSGLSADRYEGGALIQRLFARGYYAEVSGGASTDGPVYSAKVGRMGFNRTNWYLAWEGGIRATDSVALQALDGRQDRLSAYINTPISERLFVSGYAYLNWTNIGGDKLGEGFGIQYEADYTLQTETRKRPLIAVTYVGEYRKFEHSSTVPTSAQREIRRAIPATGPNASLNPTRDILTTLADDEVNRQGVNLRISKRLGSDLNAYAQVGTYYAIDDKSLEFLGTLGAEYWITDSSAIFGELRYDTSGVAGSAGAGVLEASIGGRINF